jgi:hypothetical protein
MPPPSSAFPEPRKAVNFAQSRILVAMKRALLFSLSLFVMLGCSPASHSPDAIRHDTAVATAEATRDAKAVVKGVFDGLKEKGPININKASSDDLQTLPGIGETTAQKIIAGRPYENSIELVKRHIVSKTEYDRIASHVEAK